MATLTVKNVKGLKDGSYEFRDVAFIAGGNRSGKSAILQAIQYAVFGKCDEFGSRGAGALIRNGESRSEITYTEGDREFYTLITINAKGAVSIMRSCKVNGLEVMQAEIEKLSGGVPVTIDQFMGLTGEQMWKLVTPQSGSGDIPDSILDQVNDLCVKLRDAEQDIDELNGSLLAGGDLSQKAQAILDAAKESQRSVHEFCRSLMSVQETAKPYSGPPLAELLQEEKHLKERINQGTKARAESNRSKGMIEYNQQMITQNEDKIKSMTSELQSTQVFVEKLKNCEVAIEGFVMPDFLDADKIPTSDLFSHRVARLVDSILVLNPDHPVCVKAREFSGLLSDYVSDRTYVPGRDPEFDDRFRKLTEFIAATCKGHTLRPSLNGKEEALRAIKVSLEHAELGVKSLQDRIAVLQNSIKSLTDEIGVCKNSLRAVDEEQLVKDSARLTEVTSAIKQARESQARISASQDARLRCEKLSRLDPLYDQLIKDIQKYRKSIVDDNLAAITEQANRIIEYCGLPAIELEAAAGKRPSLLVRNKTGSQFVAMSGAERLIYGAALVSAIQAVRKVVMPLLFLEAEPAENLYTDLLVLALCQHSTSRVFVAHWYKTSAVHPKLGVVCVA